MAAVKTQPTAQAQAPSAVAAKALAGGNTSAYAPTSYNAYQAAFTGVDPNAAYQSYGQNAALLAQSVQPSNDAALQAEAAQNAASGLTNSSANSYNLGNLQAQQQAALAAQYASLLGNAQNQWGQFALNDSQGQTANNEFNATQGNAANQFDAGAYNQYLQGLQQTNAQQQNMALGSYLGAFGNTSAGNVWGNAGAGQTSAYNNAFNSQNANNNAWQGVLGSALGSAGSIFGQK